MSQSYRNINTSDYCITSYACTQYIVGNLKLSSCILNLLQINLRGCSQVITALLAAFQDCEQITKQLYVFTSKILHNYMCLHKAI